MFVQKNKLKLQQLLEFIQFDIQTSVRLIKIIYYTIIKTWSDVFMHYLAKIYITTIDYQNTQ